MALGNIGDPRAVPSLIEAQHHDESLVRGHAAWALGRIGGPDAEDALEKALATEGDEGVREELALAFETGTRFRTDHRRGLTNGC